MTSARAGSRISATRSTPRSCRASAGATGSGRPGPHQSTKCASARLGRFAGPDPLRPGGHRAAQDLGRFLGQGLEQRRASREVAEEGTPYDTGGAGQFLQRGVRIPPQLPAGRGQDARPVGPRVASLRLTGDGLGHGDLGAALRGTTSRTNGAPILTRRPSVPAGPRAPPRAMRSPLPAVPLPATRPTRTARPRWSCRAGRGGCPSARRVGRPGAGRGRPRRRCGPGAGAGRCCCRRRPRRSGCGRGSGAAGWGGRP